MLYRHRGRRFHCLWLRHHATKVIFAAPSMPLTISPERAALNGDVDRDVRTSPPVWLGESLHAQSLETRCSLPLQTFLKPALVERPRARRANGNPQHPLLLSKAATNCSRLEMPPGFLGKSEEVWL